MRNSGLVSIITPAFNAAATIGESILSVQSQTYGRWELFVVDDASSDNTSAVIESFAKDDDRIHLIRLHQNTGMPGRAKNIALPFVRGDFLAFLDADDLWHKHKLEVQVDYMRRHDFGLCYSGGWLIDSSSKCFATFSPRYGSGWLFDRLLAQYEINNQSVMIRRSVLDSLTEPFFNPDITIGEDCDLFMRIACLTQVVGLPDHLVSYRVHPKSISRSLSSHSHEGLEEVVRWVRQDPQLVARCHHSLRFAEAKVNYYKASAAMDSCHFKYARSLMFPFIFIDWRYTVLFMATFSSRLWRFCLYVGRRV